jgi:hypothetical protein
LEPEGGQFPEARATGGPWVAARQLIRARSSGNVHGVKTCGQRAALVVTRVVSGTSTSIARRRVELVCSLPAGHEGEHEDVEHKERWSAVRGQIATLLRHEEDEG